MRILYHHRTLGTGAEGIHIREMVKAFRSLGHEVKVVGPVGESVGAMKDGSGFWARLKKKLPQYLLEVAEMAYNLQGLAVVCDAIRSFRPDFIYDRYVLFNAASVLAGKIFDLPVILEVNAPLALERSTQADETLLFEKIAFESEKWICSSASRTIVVSTPLADYLQLMGVPQEKIVVMPNGANERQFYPQPKSPDLLMRIGATATDVIIGFTGVMRHWHGLDLLLKSFKILHDQCISAFLLIVGDGPIREEINLLASKMGIYERIHITGFMDHDKVPGFTNLFDIAVSPKSTFYASPMKVIEYMAAGKAVVVPNLSNFLDFIDPDVNGAVFEDNDPESLARIMGNLCVRLDRCKRLGRNARFKVESRLNWRWNATEVCNLYLKMIGVKADEEAKGACQY